MVKCRFCFREFREQSYLEMHMQAEHSELDPQCKFCLKYFNLYDSLRAHLASYGKEECHQQHKEKGCAYCFAAFNTPEERDMHLMSCIDPNPPVRVYSTEVPSSKPKSFSLFASDASEDSNSFFFFNHFATIKRELQKDGDLDGIDDNELLGLMAGLQLKTLTNGILAIDCEFVGVGYKGTQDAVAKVCVIDYPEKVVYESFVKPMQPVVDYRYEFSGITTEDLENAKPFYVVKKELEQVITKDKLLVGHNVIHDLEVLGLAHPRSMIRDTAYYTPLLKPGRCSKKLKVLAKAYLNYDIQTSDTGHDPFEDAVAAMRIYKKFRHVWENRILHGVEDQKIKCYNDQRKKLMRKLQLQLYHYQIPPPVHPNNLIPKKLLFPPPQGTSPTTAAPFSPTAAAPFSPTAATQKFFQGPIPPQPPLYTPPQPLSQYSSPVQPKYSSPTPPAHFNHTQQQPPYHRATPGTVMYPSSSPALPQHAPFNPHVGQYKPPSPPLLTGNKPNGFPRQQQAGTAHYPATVPTVGLPHKDRDSVTSSNGLWYPLNNGKHQGGYLLNMNVNMPGPWNHQQLEVSPM